jgi:hypothetical protein
MSIVAMTFANDTLGQVTLVSVSDTPTRVTQANFPSLS